jgi:mevalonate kinase
MMSMKISAPGSIMLMGEHAVLRGKNAIVCSLGARIQSSVHKNTNQIIEINTQLGCIKTSINNWDVKTYPQLTYLCSIINEYIADLKSGFTLNIESDFSHLLGLGSSAAIMALAHASMHYLMSNEKLMQHEIFSRSFCSLQRIKKAGSGADIAASIQGGCILFNGKTKQTQQAKHTPNIQVIYSGNKTPTDEVIHYINERYTGQASVLDHHDNTIGELTTKAFHSIKQQQWPVLGSLMNQQQGIMRAMGLSTPEIDTALATLHSSKSVLGAKISGSGLGDCVIGLLEPQKQVSLAWQHPLMKLDVNLDSRGLTYEDH